MTAWREREPLKIDFGVLTGRIKTTKNFKFIISTHKKKISTKELSEESEHVNVELKKNKKNT